MIQTIAFIGSGMIGGSLARLAVASGFNVVLSNSRGPDTLAELVAELGDRARAATPAEAAEAGDLVVATVPLKAHRSLPVDSLRGKVVIDTMNYYPSRDGQMPDIDAAKLTTSELVQRQLQGAKVVKALHNLDFHHLLTNARPDGDADRTTLPIAGDDAEAKEKVAQFMDAIGYDSIDIGPLSESWRIEPGTPIYVWPYVPKIPEGLSEEEARRLYMETSGAPVSREQAKELVAKAARSGPVGGFAEVLPPVHLALVAEAMSKQRR
jgi:predicted dinucleotide-binding enzyme